MVQLSGIVYGCLAIIIGIIFLFFGIRMFRTVIAATGFMVGALVAFVLIHNIRAQHSWGAHGDLYTLSICLVVGVVGAIVGLSIWMLALVAIGALGGLGSVLYVLSWKADLLAPHIVAFRPLILVAACVLGGILAIVYERGVIILATAIVGAIAVCSGVDVFAQTGFNGAMQQFVRNKTPPPADGATFMLLGVCGAVAILGVLIQVSVTNKKLASSK